MALLHNYDKVFEDRSARPVGIAAVTCMLPSRRAARLDPATQLKA